MVPPTIRRTPAIRTPEHEERQRLEMEDLRARIISAELFAQVLLSGYAALRSHGVDFMKLREWKENAVLDEARKLKPRYAVEKITAYLTRLDNAIAAAVRRKAHVKLHTDNTKRED